RRITGGPQVTSTAIHPRRPTAAARPNWTPRRLALAVVVPTLAAAAIATPLALTGSAGAGRNPAAAAAGGARAAPVGLVGGGLWGGRCRSHEGAARAGGLTGQGHQQSGSSHETRAGGLPAARLRARARPAARRCAQRNCHPRQAESCGVEQPLRPAPLDEVR